MEAADNMHDIDYKPSATTTKDSFRGTGISLMQHHSHEFEGNNQVILIIDQTTSGKAIVLLASCKIEDFKESIINNPI